MCEQRPTGIKRVATFITQKELFNKGLSHCLAITFVMRPEVVNMFDVVADGITKATDENQPVAVIFKRADHSKETYGLHSMCRIQGTSVYMGWCIPRNCVTLDMSSGKYPLLAFPRVGDTLPAHATGLELAVIVIATLPAPIKSGVYDNNTRVLVCRGLNHA